MATETKTKTKYPSNCHLEGAGCSAPSPTWHWGGHLARRQCGGGWCEAQLLPWLLGECPQVQSSGSLLAALLARSWGQSAQRADPALGSLFLFSRPQPKTRRPAGAGWDAECPPVLKPRKGAGHLASYPLPSPPWASLPPRQTT